MFAARFYSSLGGTCRRAAPSRTGLAACVPLARACMCLADTLMDVDGAALYIHPVTFFYNLCLVLVFVPVPPIDIPLYSVPRSCALCPTSTWAWPSTWSRR